MCLADITFLEVTHRHEKVDETRISCWQLYVTSLVGKQFRILEDKRESTCTIATINQQTIQKLLREGFPLISDCDQFPHLVTNKVLRTYLNDDILSTSCVAQH